jgi:hypothetical protein
MIHYYKNSIIISCSSFSCNLQIFTSWWFLVCVKIQYEILIYLKIIIRICEKYQKKNVNIDLNNNFLRSMSHLFKTRNHRSRLIDNKSIIKLDHREYLIIWHEIMIVYAFIHLETFLFVKYNHAMIKWFFFDY